MYVRLMGNVSCIAQLPKCPSQLQSDMQLHHFAMPDWQNSLGAAYHDLCTVYGLMASVWSRASKSVFAPSLLVPYIYTEPAAMTGLAPQTPTQGPAAPGKSEETTPAESPQAAARPQARAQASVRAAVQTPAQVPARQPVRRTLRFSYRFPGEQPCQLAASEDADEPRTSTHRPSRHPKSSSPALQQPQSLPTSPDRVTAWPGHSSDLMGQSSAGDGDCPQGREDGAGSEDAAEGESTALQASEACTFKAWPTCCMLDEHTIAVEDRRRSVVSAMHAMLTWQ